MTLWRLFASVSLCLLALSGCEAPNGPHGIDFSKTFFTQKNTHAEEVKCREDYQTSRSHKALRWLMANCVNQGMTRQDVDNVIGEPGELEENAGFLKRRGSIYRVDDKAYRYGPDDKGQVIYLFFREGKLVNFEPDRFAD